MTPGQKLNLIKKIALRMSTDTYPDGDLVLRQFSLPTTDYWDGPKEPYYYYATMLERGEDQHLLELHEYLFPGDLLPGTTVPTDLGNWEKESFRLFISHSTKQKLLVTQVKHELQEYGVESFVAHEDIAPTTDWLNEIRKALNTCHAFTALICEEFPKSKYCDQEVGFAMQRGVLVIPIRLEGDPHGFMAPLQGVTAFDKAPKDIAADIFKLIEKNPATAKLAEKAKRYRLEQLTDEFLNSSNFSASTTLLRKLEDYDSLPSNLLQKIHDGWKKNDQIYNCAKIPKRMEWFFKKHRFEPLPF